MQKITSTKTPQDLMRKKDKEENDKPIEIMSPDTAMAEKPKREEPKDEDWYQTRILLLDIQSVKNN